MVRKISQEHEDAIVEAYLNGATLQEVATQFGYHLVTCARVLKRRGVIPRSRRSSRGIPKEHEDAMIEAYLAGATLREAASLFGYDKTTCSNVLKRYGIVTRDRGVPKEHEDAIIAAYLAGATQAEAAALFGYNETTCANILKRRDIPVRSLSEALRIPKEHEDGMIAAYLSGASAEKAAALFGYTDGTCFSALRRRGITPRSHTEVCRIPLKHEEAIVAAYLAGATQADAAALFGYSGDACLNALKRRGIVPRSYAEVFRIPLEHEEEIVAAYLAGATQEEAAALFGYSGKTCLNVLKRRGIIPRNHAEVCSIPPEHEEGMIAAYLAGASTDQAAALFGHNGQTSANVLKRRGIGTRSRRQYAVDESFFDCIDTEEKAYWLGFLTADGGIVGHQIILQLKVSDIYHLHKFAASLDSGHPVSVVNVRGYGRTQPMARLVISSVRLIQALSYLGVGENKSFTVRPCESVPESLLNAYWRGIFDGDGSISRMQSQWSISLCGNLAIVKGFQSFVTQFVHSNAQVRPNKNIFRVSYAGKKLPRAVGNVLYREANIYLDRKYALAKQLCGEFLVDRTATFPEEPS